MKKKLPLKSVLSPKVEIRSSPVQGKGMFAKEAIKKGEVLVIWGAKYITKKEAEQVKKENPTLLIMQWDANLFSVEERGDDIGYFINHSCDSNMWMDDAITLSARRDIKKGEELTADYALWEARTDYVSKWTCNCGSPLCRRKITSQDWKLPEIQKRYENHFAPLINKKIKKLNRK